MNKNTEIKITNFLLNELNSGLGNFLVIKDDTSNEYFLFNKYYISERKQGNYEVRLAYTDEICVFNSLKNAVCFCIFDKANKFNEITKLKTLDLNLASVDVSIQQLQKILKKTKTTEQKLIYIAKLNEELLRKKRMKAQLTGCIDKAKFWQATKFGI